jgi:hypothetical protein
MVAERALSFKSPRASASLPLGNAGAIPRRNYVDEAIFGKMAQDGISPARLTTDEEFVRRIYLDLTGRLVTPDQLRTFVASTNENKRAELIDRLLYSPEFTDKWTMWWGDLLQNAQNNSFRNLTQNARNAFYTWIATSVSENKSMRDMVFEVLTAKGTPEAGGASAPSAWSARWQTPGGPIQDTYDTLFSRSATQFLGMAHYDCLLCHDGRGRLGQLTLWGARATRMEAYQMAAYFSRIRFANRGAMDAQFPNSTDVTDVTTGGYTLNTTFGNRPRRSQVGLVTTAAPAWRMGDNEPTGADYRAVYAQRLTADRMFARNFANRLWKAMFNMGLVEPVDQLDPARLDPANPPTSGDWKLQATHPELLERLADELIENNFNLREFLRRLAESSAYQLSSDYGAAWRPDAVNYFARHYVRRLEGEEIHDAIYTATGVITRYTVGGWSEPTEWAMKLPEPVEPRGNGTTLGFMNLFLRGNRDNQFRSQDGSILQQLNLMNNSFVTGKAKVAASAFLRSMGTLTDSDTVAEEMFVRFLGRRPTAAEKTTAKTFLGRATTLAQRNTAVEDLAWALMNKQEFIFSY